MPPIDSSAPYQTNKPYAVKRFLGRFIIAAVIVNSPLLLVLITMALILLNSFAELVGIPIKHVAPPAEYKNPLRAYGNIAIIFAFAVVALKDYLERRHA